MHKEKKNNISILGCGAWATSIAHVLSAVHRCKIWCHRPEIVDEINVQHTRKILPGVTLNEQLQATLDMQACLEEADAIVFCVASPYVLETLEKWKPFFNADIPVLSLTKGIVSDSDIWLRSMFKENLPSVSYSVLSGPNLALEIAEGKPAASVVASDSMIHANFFQTLLSSNQLRVYTSSDIKGVTLGGILKNIFAIAAGCADAMEYGANTKASLITRALQEMIRLGNALGASPDTMMGLSGLGDLIATCNSTQSRNYKVGFGLGKGMALSEIVQDMGAVAEGINTTKKIVKYANKLNVDMPITQVVYAILCGDISPETAIQQLMSRKLTME
ncbi:NAD(P)H-dependent glycerol-3-phosphate dehydrogenase [Candidatus Marinamargulisbacteria bacterium SCGC AG-343-D04]|nr:NAD(P)H-dependent glycerol-3-phosphate dehydrogenase [Candidatus Marinamargulisbacteria bacterium SCGC AG-343-D04]